MMRKVVSMLLAFVMIVSLPAVVYAEEVPVDTGATTEATATAPLPAVPFVLGPPATIIVYRNCNIMGVYDANNQLLKACLVSTGKPGHETPLGVYQIYQHTDKGGYHPMVDGTYGRWCMRFKQGGYMFHSVCYAYNGAPEPIPEEVAAIGTSVSLGCVRLNVADAEWLYKNTSNGCSVIIADY